MSIKQLLSFTLACVAFILTTLYCVAKSNQNIVDTTVLSEWQAGKTVTADVVKAFGGIDKCFAAESIPDEVWQRMQGKSYKDNPYIGRNDLRHICALHWDYDEQMHVGEMICNFCPMSMTLMTRLRCVTTTHRVSAIAPLPTVPSSPSTPAV